MKTLPTAIHATWQNKLSPLFDLPIMEELRTQILPKCMFYPSFRDIFNVFSMPFNEVNVVILGQDPYPRQGQATGYSFAVAENTAIPASLRTIQKEVRNNFPDDSEVEKRMSLKTWRTLSHWRKQGVFLLNTALTVEKDRPGSHIKHWKPFTNEVIKMLASRNPVWVLWGSYAKEYEKMIEAYSGDKVPRILFAPHPATENYPGSSGGFYGCNHFRIINYLLFSEGKPIINW